MPLPIIFLELYNFKRFISASLLALLLVSFYSLLQLPVFGLIDFLPILAREGMGARVSGFLGINSNASYLVVLITTLDLNINRRNFSLLSLPSFGFLNFTSYTFIMTISFFALLFTGSRAAIVICILLALIRRLPFILKFLIGLRFRYIYVFLVVFVVALLSYASNLNYSQCYSCNYIHDSSKALASLAPRLSQLSHLDAIISSPYSYILGTVDLGAPDIVGDNPWLEYTLDYGLLYTFSLMSSLFSLGLLLVKSHHFLKFQATPYSRIYSQVPISLLYGLSSIALLMLFYDSPQAAPTFLLYLVMCYSFIAFYIKCSRPHEWPKSLDRSTPGPPKSVI
jgi:hypothetical protein